MARKHTALAIVAHPDDETLWAGGTILSRDDWDWTVIALCRRSDPDRAPRFARALERLGAVGIMGDMDDGPDQTPLPAETVEAVITRLLPQAKWDSIFSHSPFGEYTRHRRHEETARAVMALWRNGSLECGDISLFAYEDGDRSYYPRAIERAHVLAPLEETIWRSKREIIESVYGFSSASWEARAAPRVEGFWRFHAIEEYLSWLALENG
jgi:LmbE family N-acetylglucosaminyl deacetylase